MNGEFIPIRELKKITELIPHRPPMVMVSGLLEVSDKDSLSELYIADNNLFLEGELFSEAGIIEHMAQTAALEFGFRGQDFNKIPQIGYIASISNCYIYKCPSKGDTLLTRCQIEYGSETLKKVNLTTEIRGETIATAKMTLLIKSE